MSANTLFCAGRLYNLLSRAVSVTPSTENADAPVERLWDERPVDPFRFETVDDDHAIDVDLQTVVNGGFETAFAAGVPGAGWTKSAGATLERDTAEEQSGVACLVARGAAANADYAEYSLEVRAGEVLTISVALKKVSAGGAAARVDVRIEEAGLWLQSDGDWSESVVALDEETGTAYATVTVQATVPEDLPNVQTLIVRLYAGEDTVAHNAYDNLTVIPAVSFASIHGHDFDQRVAASLIHDDQSDFAGTPQTIALTLARPTFYKTFAPVTRRYWRLLLEGADLPAYGIGQFVLAQHSTLNREPDHPERTPHEVSHTRPQVRHETGSGDAYVYNLGEERRRVVLPYDGEDDEIDELLEVIRNSGSGASTIVVVPRTDRPDAILGRVTSEYQTSRFLDDRVGTVLEIQESALPQLVE